MDELAFAVARRSIYRRKSLKELSGASVRKADVFDMKLTTNRLGRLLGEPYLALLIVTEMLFLWMVTNNPDELGSNGGRLVSLYIMVICLLQMAMLALLHRIVRARGVAGVYIQRMAFAVFLVFNIYTVLLVHIPSQSGIYAYKSFISVVLLLTILLLFSVKAWKFINVSALAFGMIVSTQFYFTSDSLVKEVAPEIENAAMPKIAEAATFERHPNVYFLSFDAFIPTDIANFFLQQPEPRYSLYLKKHDFREVKNAFATGVLTKPSLNAIAAVDTKICDKLGRVCWGLVLGKYPSALYTVFKKNGYTTIFAYHTYYFGDEKGPYLDRYVVENKITICDHIDEKLAFLGYCSLEKNVYLKPVFGIIDPQQTIETLISGSVDSSPHFVMAYIYSPGHTPLDYDTFSTSDFRKYQKFFWKNQLETVRQLETFIEAIKARDPNSVVIIFGDHGAWISRSWKGKEGEPDPAGIVWNEDLMILERHRVALFVYPKDFCVDEFRQPYTLNRLGRSVAKCLSNGQDPFSEKHHDGDRDWSRYVIPK